MPEQMLLGDDFSLTMCNRNMGVLPETSGPLIYLVRAQRILLSPTTRDTNGPHTGPRFTKAPWGTG